MPSSLGPAEILVILIVALIVLGPTRLPEAGRQIGKALSEIRRWSARMQSEVRDAIEGDPDEAPPAPSPGPSADRSGPPPPTAPDFR